MMVRGYKKKIVYVYVYVSFPSGLIISQSPKGDNLVWFLLDFISFAFHYMRLWDSFFMNDFYQLAQIYKLWVFEL